MLQGKIWPNGEFGIRVARPSVSVGFKKQKPLSESQRFSLELMKAHGIFAAIAVQKKEGAEPLGLSLLSNFTKRSGRGGKGISRLGCRKVRNAAFLMQREAGKECLSFLTLTVPRLTPEEWEVVADRWARIVDNVREALTYHLFSAGLPAEVVGVTEIQSGRLKLRGEPGFHLHFLFVGRKRGKAWAICTKKIDRLWEGILSRQVGRQCICSSACSIQRVKKNAEGYLGKYMTKGSAELKVVKEKMPNLRLPTAWYSLSRSLLGRIRRMTVCGANALRMVWNASRVKDERVIKFVGSVFLTSRDGRELEIARYGRVALWVVDLFAGCIATPLVI